MLQSRTISEASFTFVSIREFMVVNRACFQIQGFIFRLRLYYGGCDAEMIHDVMVTAGHVIQHHRRSRCATK